MSSLNGLDMVVGAWVRIEDDVEIYYEVASDGTHVEFCFGGRHDFDLTATPGALRALVGKGAEALQRAEQAKGVQRDEGA